MDKIELNEKALQQAMEVCLSEWAEALVSEIAKVTPRDIEWLPKNTIDRKDGKKPYRSSEYKPTQIFGHWYEGVSGRLKKSLTFKVEWNKAMVWVMDGGDTSEYSRALEYGTPHIAPRKFIRWTIESQEAQHIAKKAMDSALEAYLKKIDRD